LAVYVASQENPSPEIPLICVVDDDPSVVRSLGRLLASYGLTSRPFTSPQRFLAEEGFSGANCLIVDIHMPRMSGYELANQLADERPDLPIIFITAQSEERDRWRHRAGSAVALLVKPFSDQELTSSLEQALGHPLAS
jgi:FixJ family two-component response regulator